MSKLYIPVSSVEQANYLKSLLWQLTSPDLDNVTQYYSEPIFHPVTNQIVLPIDSENFLIHQNANKFLFDILLSDAISLGLAAIEDVVETQEKIDTYRGQKVNLQTVLPSSFISKLLTYEELKAEGWFDEEKGPN